MAVCEQGNDRVFRHVHLLSRFRYMGGRSLDHNLDQRVQWNLAVRLFTKHLTLMCHARVDLVFILAALFRP